MMCCRNIAWQEFRLDNFKPETEKWAWALRIRAEPAMSVTSFSLFPISIFDVSLAVHDDRLRAHARQIC